MREVIFASHGNFSEGIKDSVSMIIGEQSNVRSYQLKPGASATDFAEELQKEITENPETEYVILTDLYGASVCSAMLPLTMNSNVHVFSGMNLVLALTVLLETREPLNDEIISEILNEAKEGIRLVKMEDIREEDF